MQSNWVATFGLEKTVPHNGALFINGIQRDNSYSDEIRA